MTKIGKKREKEKGRKRARTRKSEKKKDGERKRKGEKNKERQRKKEREKQKKEERRERDINLVNLILYQLFIPFFYFLSCAIDSPGKSKLCCFSDLVIMFMDSSIIY